MLASIRLVVVPAALMVSLFGLFVSLSSVPEPGVRVTSDGTAVSDVVPGSPGWRDGIRSGDAVVEIHDASEPGGWSILVGRGGVERGTSDAAALSRLRAAALAGVAAVILAIVASLAIVRGGTAALALIPLVVGLAAIPLSQTGNVRDGLIAGPGTFTACGLSVGLLAGVRVRGIPLFLLGLGLAALSAIGLVWGAPWFNSVDAVRAPVALGSSLLGGWLTVDRRQLLQRLASPGGPRLFDLVYLPAVITVLVAAVLLLKLPPTVAFILAVVAALLYPASRRASGLAFERLVVGTLRREAEIRAIEEERGRLAREIHDAPLQGLAAVIRRLEGVPGAAGEASALREVAGQLRGVATTLHPPVLEDLGLVPALLDLGEALSVAYPDMSIEVEVDDLTSARSRPHGAVEVAAYRIVQEAAGNALRHSGGKVIAIRGSVGTQAIDLTVSDDGAGIDRRAAQAARRAGHFGIDSMRERAEAVGADLAVSSDRTGVRVKFLWSSNS